MEIDSSLCLKFIDLEDSSSSYTFSSVTLLFVMLDSHIIPASFFSYPDNLLYSSFFIKSINFSGEVHKVIIVVVWNSGSIVDVEPSLSGGGSNLNHALFEVVLVMSNI